jgi:putative transport protein
MLSQLLENTPLLALFLAIGLGYAIGQVNVWGLSLGVGGVLFSALAIGAFAPKSVPPPMVGTIGLILFLYGIGIQFGPQFFAGLSGPARRYNLLALAGVAASLLVALLAGQIFGFSMATAVGVFAGSMTSTAALQAAIDASGSRDPAIGYSVAYPFGVLGPILCFFLMQRLLAPVVPAVPASLIFLEVTLEPGVFTGCTIAELSTRLPAGVQVTGVRQNHRSHVAHGDMQVQAGDALALAGSPAALEQARLLLGRPAPGRVLSDRSEFDYVRVFVSKPGLIGLRLGEMVLPKDLDMRVIEVRRGDKSLLPEPGFVLEYGDRLSVLGPAAHRGEIRRFFGDSITATAEFSYISVGLGLALGVLIGLISIPIPGLGRFSLGIAGGPLIVALVLGRLGRLGGVSWRMPVSANMVLRNFGLTLFLASVGLSAGAPFLSTVASSGPALLLVGAASLLACVMTVLLVGYYVMRVPFDDLLGIAAGATGNPAIPAFGARLVKTEQVSVGYAMIFPGMTILKVLMAQVAIGLLGGS